MILQLNFAEMRMSHLNLYQPGDDVRKAERERVQHVCALRVTSPLKVSHTYIFSSALF